MLRCRRRRWPDPPGDQDTRRATPDLLEVTAGLREGERIVSRSFDVGDDIAVVDKTHDPIEEYRVARQTRPQQIRNGPQAQRKPRRSGITQTDVTSVSRRPGPTTIGPEWTAGKRGTQGAVRTTNRTNYTNEFRDLAIQSKGPWTLHK